MMKKINLFKLLMIYVLGASALQAAGLSTQRIEQLSNARVTVWKTIIYPLQNKFCPCTGMITIEFWSH
ncbi:hypothetical protein PGH42_15010 [Legionella pneumophila]|nr:hypothetical protein PGH42_15010 [Legionella pneumophila]